MYKKPVLNNTQNLLLRAISEIALFVLCIVPGLIFSFKSLQEPWNLFRLARAYFFLYNPARATFSTAGAGYRVEHLGVEMIQTTLITVTGWPLEAIALIPIGSLLLALLYYGLARCVSRSRWTAGAITIYLTWYYPTLYSQFSTQTYVWTHTLFFSFLILLFFWIRRRTFALSLLMMVVFIATFLQYHTTPLWIVAALITAVGAIKLKEYKQKILPSTVSWALPLFCVVFYFTFDTVVYGNGLVRLKTEAVHESFFQSVFYKVVVPLFSPTSNSVLNVFETAQLSPSVAVQSTLLILLLLTVPVAIWGMVKIYHVVISRDMTSLIQENETIFVLVIIVTATSHILLYALYGAISFRVIPLAFPLILPLIVRKLNWAHKLELILTSGLAVLSIVGFMSFASTLQPDTLASQAGLASKLFKENDRLLGDANIYGAFLVNSAQDNKVIDFVWPDSAKYRSVAGQAPLKPDDFDYLVVDMSNKPITSANWRFLEPWTWHLQSINQNSSLNKIYDSEYLKIFQPGGVELPHYQLTPQNFDIANRSFIIDTFRLFLTIIILAFIPGTVLLVIVHHSLPAAIDNSATIGLAVGLSIAFAILLSYIAYFTPLGLAWFVPLGVLVTLDILGVYLFIRYYKFHFQRSWVVTMLSLVVTLLIWSFMSTSVAHIRTQQSAEFTEFFVTQVDPQSGSLNVNVVNRLSNPANFTMTFSLNGIEVQTIGPQLLSPNAAWIEKWPMPLTAMDDRLVITLKKDGTLHRDLHLTVSTKCRACQVEVIDDTDPTSLPY
jgi:hypothetical protein